MNTLATEMRFCSDIGMFTLDREIATSCVHKTEFCKKTCFNNKLFKVYPAMHQKDKRNELAWTDNNATELAKSLARRKKFTDRFRFMSRGEAFSNFDDIDLVENIIKATPNIVHWIPTRAWTNGVLFNAVLARFKQYSNVRILASMDPSNSTDQWEHVKNLGVNTMFYGDNTMTTTPNGDRMFICPKTHKHMNGHCSICKGGCFRTSKRVDVHLKQH